MPWTTTITLDADKPDVGTATAVWNAGQADEFTYSRRAKVNLAEGRAFAAEAVAARKAAAARRTQEASLAGTLADLLATEEAK